VAAPDAVEELTREDAAAAPAPEPSDAERELVDTVVADGELHRLLEIRVPELAAYQSLAYARRYAEKVGRVLAAEQERTPGHTELTEAVARNLFKLMAYKDEYEVARLHLDAIPPEGKIWFNLQPPLLRALGLKRKIKLGRWFVPFFRMLRAARRLRGTPFDVFGYAKVRRTERALIGEYEDLVLEAIAHLREDTHETAVELCELPDVIRGYEEIKLRNVVLFRKRAEALVRRLRSGKPAPELLSS
jgi:indolepyruvate ferredoxin oxidoreductase